MKRRISILVTCVVLLFACRQPARAQEVVEEVNSQYSLAQLIASLREQWSQGDNILSTLDQARKSNDLWDALYSGARLIESAPLLDELVEVVNRYATTYQSLLDQYEYYFTEEITDYEEIWQRLMGVASLTDQVYKDFKFITDCLFTKGFIQGTEKEKHDLFKEYLGKIEKSLGLLEEEKENTKSNAVIREGLKTLDVIQADSYDEMMQLGLTSDMKLAYRMATFTQADWDRISEQVIKNRNKEKEKEEKERLTQEEKKGINIAIKLAMILIIGMSGMYVPYNMWKVNSGERQSADAFIRIIVGFLIGFLGLMFIKGMVG